MKQIPQTYPFYLYDVPNHAEIKPLILDGIRSMGTHSMFVRGQHTSNTDWHLGRDCARPYYTHLVELFAVHSQKLVETSGMPATLSPVNYWFQQYRNGDYHEWHVHPNVMFANVYYLDLPAGASKTSFKVGDREFEVEANEGQILTFPTCFIHCSKPNLTGVKTVIAFNY